jgi:hypothetical protein
MRDILDLLQQLTESTGLAGRKPGDLFRNPEGTEITFNDIKFFPEGGGKLPPDQLATAIAQVTQDLGNIQWQNAKSSRTGGFAISSFTTPDGEMYVGQYLEQVKPNKTDNYVPNQFGDYKFGGKAAAKTQAKLTPQDLLTDKLDLTIPMIMNQLASSLGTDNPLYSVAHSVAMGEGLPIEFPIPPGVSFSGFRDYFCEILQPMALKKGTYTGNAGEAAEKFLDGTFANALISFDTSKNAGLSDSIMVNPDGKTVKVSSKGGKGATASAKNLIDSVNDLQQTDNGRKLIKKYSQVIDLLRDMQAAGQAGAPLLLGVKYGIIDDADANTIKALKNTPPVNLNAIDRLKISNNLKKLAKERTTRNPEQVNLYYHLMAAVAHKAAEQVNEKTNFSKAAADILNNGALVQVYTTATEGKKSWVLKAFETFYPGDATQGVYLSASKNYSSTDIKGNFTFKIDRGSGVPKDEANADAETAQPAAAEVSLDTAAADIVNGRRPGSGDEPEPAAQVGVGRNKRK